jgi:pilus assembly protein Flp/PilA
LKDIEMMQFLTLLQTWLGARRDDERGVTAVEYGLMVAFIAGAIIVGATALGDGLNSLFQSAADFVGGISF